MFYNYLAAQADRKIKRPDEHGPFDIIADVHGCYDELLLLLQKIGYVIETHTENICGIRAFHPLGRKLIFAGDMVDRGPKIMEVLKLAMSMIVDDTGMSIPGNHDEKFMRYLMGRKIVLNPSIATSVNQLKKESLEFKAALKLFLQKLPTYLLLDDDKLVVAHAGLKEKYHGRASKEVRENSLYGATTGEHDEDGKPLHYNWAKDYRGSALVVYGHTPVLEPYRCNNTIDIDTGCIFGGRLTAFQYPEMNLVSVSALQEYESGEGVFGMD